MISYKTLLWPLLFLCMISSTHAQVNDSAAADINPQIDNNQTNNDSKLTTTTQASPAKLVFTTAAQTLTAGTTSGTITVQRQSASNTPTTNGALTVYLFTSSSGGVFRNTADSATITSVTIPDGSSSASFRYKDTVAGSPTITASDANPANGNTGVQGSETGGRRRRCPR